MQPVQLLHYSAQVGCVTREVSLEHQPSLVGRVSAVCAHRGHLSNISRGPKAIAARWLLDHHLIQHSERLSLGMVELAGWNGRQSWDLMSSTCRDLGDGILTPKCILQNMISVPGCGKEMPPLIPFFFSGWGKGADSWACRWLVPAEENKKSVFCCMMSNMLHDGHINSNLVCVMGTNSFTSCLMGTNSLHHGKWRKQTLRFV